jgi:hypothetical protein
MKQCASALLFLSLNINLAWSQCPNPIYLGDTLGFYSNLNCGPGFTFASITDSDLAFELVPGNPTNVTAYIDAFRIDSIQGVPAGLVITTDVIGTADINGPYGYWYNGGVVPNQSPTIGCLDFTGDANLIASLSTGGPNNDGVYPLIVNLDRRIAETSPNLSSIIPDGSWFSGMPEGLGGGIMLFEVSLYVGVSVGGVTSSTIVSGPSCVLGSAEITLSGASLPITYSLDNSNPITTPANVISLANLDNGAHTVSGLDNVGCVFVEDFQIDGIIPYQQESLCLVTVDSVSGENLVVWEKTLSVFSEGFKIHKQNNITSQYDSIGWVSIDSLSTFQDVGSNPQQGSDRYKISVVDECGAESNISFAHRTIHLSANQGINGEVNLSWNAYEGFSYSNFEIYRSNNGNPYVLINNVANNNFAYTDLTPPNGVNYYRVGVVNPSGCNPTRSVLRSYSNVIDDTGNPVSVSEEHSHSERLLVYPNPSKGLFQVEGEGTLTVFNAIGQNLIRKDILGSFTVDLGMYPNGIYTVQLQSAKSLSSIKLIKE